MNAAHSDVRNSSSTPSTGIEEPSTLQLAAFDGYFSIPSPATGTRVHGQHRNQCNQHITKPGVKLSHAKHARPSIQRCCRSIIRRVPTICLPNTDTKFGWMTSPSRASNRHDFSLFPFGCSCPTYARVCEHAGTETWGFCIPNTGGQSQKHLRTRNRTVRA